MKHTAAILACVFGLFAAAAAADGVPGQAAAQRLGTTAVNPEHPAPPDATVDHLDDLGPGSGGPADDTLRHLGLKPVPENLAPAPAGNERLKLSVEQAVMLGLENNRSLQVQQLQPVIASTFEDIERAVFDPTVYAEADYSGEQAQQVSRATRDVYRVRGNDITISAGVQETLPTGTDLQLSLKQTRSVSTRSPEQDTARVGLTLTQALLRGAGLKANLASIRQAQVNTLASVYELRGFTENLVATIESTYWDYVLAKRRIDIYTSALGVARQQLAETQKRIQVGQLPETELAAARAEVAQRQQDLIDARSSRDSLRLTMLQLLNVSSDDDGWSRHINTTSSPELGKPLPMASVSDLIALALRLRPELNQARLELEHGRLQVVKTRNGLLPKLDLFLTLGKSGYTSSFSSTVNDIGGPSYDISAGVRLELPIFNRDAEARHRNAVSTRDQARESLENLAQTVSLDVRKAYVEVQRSRDQIKASAATRSLQEEVLRAEQTKFRVGNATAFSVAQAQRDMIQSQIGEVEALVTYRKALIDLYRLDGTLLMRQGIKAPGDKMVNVLAY